MLLTLLRVIAAAAAGVDAAAVPLPLPPPPLPGGPGPMAAAARSIPAAPETGSGRLPPTARRPRVRGIAVEIERATLSRPWRASSVMFVLGHRRPGWWASCGSSQAAPFIGTAGGRAGRSTDAEVSDAAGYNTTAGYRRPF